MLAVRSLLPAGFMLQPSAAGDGALSIVICSGHGPETITLDSDGKPSESRPAKSEAGLCPYSAFATPVLGGGEPPAVASPVRYVSVNYPRPVELARVDLPSGATSARGPPSFQT
jgi:hypothetical protein